LVRVPVDNRFVNTPTLCDKRYLRSTTPIFLQRGRRRYTSRNRTPKSVLSIGAKADFEAGSGPISIGSAGGSPRA
jgi:hypothetical protein